MIVVPVGRYCIVVGTPANGDYLTRDGEYLGRFVGDEFHVRAPMTWIPGYEPDKSEMKRVKREGDVPPAPPDSLEMFGLLTVLRVAREAERQLPSWCCKNA